MLTDALSEGLSLTDALSEGLSLSDALSDGHSLTDALSERLALTDALSEGLDSTDALSECRCHGKRERWLLLADALSEAPHPPTCARAAPLQHCARATPSARVRASPRLAVFRRASPPLFCSARSELLKIMITVQC